MSKNFRTYLILSALVLLLVGMGCTTATTVSASTAVAVEPAQSGDEPLSTDSDESDPCDMDKFEEVEPPADLIPGYLPEGYELDGAYSFDAAEFEEDAIWFVPGKGAATSVEFFGSGEEDFIEITASDSPYDSLETWIDEVNNIDFDEEDEDFASEDEDLAEDEDFDVELSFEDDTVTIQGVTVLLEDWTDEYGPYSAATFIHDGQFIVIEGTISVEEMTKVIESLPVLP